jgi:hypothetical protein
MFPLFASRDAFDQHLGNQPHLKKPGGASLFVGALIGGTLAPAFDWVLLPIVGGADWWSYRSSADTWAIPHLLAGGQLVLNNMLLAVATVAISSLVAYRGFVLASQLRYMLPVAAALGLFIAIFFEHVLDLASFGGWEAILIHNISFAYGSALLWLAYQLNQQKRLAVG